MDRRTKRLLREFREACIAAAHAKFAGWPKEYRRRLNAGTLPSPLWGHCGPVSSAVRGMFGGEILFGMVRAPEHDMSQIIGWFSHYWNLLPCGVEVDLTSCQFGGDGFTPVTAGSQTDEGKDEPTPMQFLAFAERVLETLSGQELIT